MLLKSIDIGNSDRFGVSELEIRNNDGWMLGTEWEKRQSARE